MKEETGIPFKFNWKWLAGPILLLIIAVGIAWFVPVPESPNPIITTTPQIKNPIIPIVLDLEQAKQLAGEQCGTIFDCSAVDCLEKVLTQIDSSSKTIHAVLRTPSPKALRDHIRAAIARGVEVNMVLDPTLNPKFYLQGANIRIKTIPNFIAANFIVIDSQKVMFGSNPGIFASSPDIIEVACDESITQAYESLFQKVWKEESASFTSQTNEEETLSENEISSNTLSNSTSCSQEECGPDTYYCESTTKIWKHYFCTEIGCAYDIIPLYFSPDCGYENPGFDSEGNPLIVFSEVEVDEGVIQNEFVEFLALQPLELTHFTLLKNDEELITFAEPFILNGTARVYTTTGESTTQIVYLNYPNLLWIEQGTTATLVNPFGEIVATRTFEE